MDLAVGTFSYLPELYLKLHLLAESTLINSHDISLRSRLFKLAFSSLRTSSFPPICIALSSLIVAYGFFLITVAAWAFLLAYSSLFNISLAKSSVDFTWSLSALIFLVMQTL